MLTVAVAAVWLVNGVWCKILHQVPRHEAIVARILGGDVAPALTVMIGLGEVFIAVWLLSRRFSRVCTALQIGLVLTMNIIERVLAPDLLLFGNGNLGLAVLLCVVIFVQYRSAR